MSVLPTSDLINTVNVYTQTVDKYGDSTVSLDQVIRCRLDIGQQEFAFPPSSRGQDGENTGYDAVLHCNGTPLLEGYIVEYENDFFEVLSVQTIQDLGSSQKYQFATLKRNLNAQV
jgi:hypothetical protein